MGPRIRPEDDRKAPDDDRKKGPSFALRLGFRQVKGLKQAEMERLVARRGDGYADLADLRRRAEISAAALDRLARADAFGSLDLARRGALWAAIGLDRTGHELDLPPLLAWARDRPPPDPGAPAPAAPAEQRVELPAMTLGEEVAEDYANLRLTLRAHPLALLRGFLGRRVIRAEHLADIDDGRRVEVAGLALVRQRPGTASGVIFITIEDESGITNLVVWPAVFERFRRVVLGAQLLVVRGLVQKEGLVIHVVAEHLEDRSDLLRRLGETDRPFEAPVARADRIKRPRDGARRRTPSPDTAAAVTPESPDQTPRPSAEPFQAPHAHADHANGSGGPDPRDPFFRPRDLDHFRPRQPAFQSPVARADDVKRNTKNARELHPSRKLPGFRSRDFH